ncbi:MAG: ABC transporter ATP-binding protein [Leptospiraceae bacterium]|nr:ABC transporter ATP-binding protein [Leptospiraceae bacterium]MDW7974967.1 ABC transporter ATP-binding protein [Leptospiraceae bacterium]
MKKKKDNLALKVEHLSIGIQSDKLISIVDDVSFSLFEGEIFGLVGESGCGKTLTSMGIVRMPPEPNGKILSGEITLYLNGTEIRLDQLSEQEIRKIRGAEIGVIFQEPFMALNPLYTVEHHLKELYIFHKEEFKKKQISFENRVVDLLKKMNFPQVDTILRSYPHQLSGGMLQRIVILLAILLKPKLVIADEPTTALDVTVQAQIMNILKELQEEENATILLITHNMGLLAQYADRLAVMYAGKIVEQTDVERFLNQPLHPYSQGLLKAIPDLDVEKTIQGIPGQVPPPELYPKGCRFENRCSYRFELCKNEPKPISFDQHIVYCWKYSSN